MKLENMKNIGNTLAISLRAVGIETPEDLIKKGSVETLLLLGDVGATCSNKLYALEGAILDIRWHDLDKQHREALYNNYKRIRDEINLRD